MSLTIKDVATAAWALIQKIPVTGTLHPLDAFVGAQAAGMIEHQFTQAALNKLTQVKYVKGLESPKLKALAVELHSTGKLPGNQVIDLKKAIVKDISPATYLVLEQFDRGDFYGITYDKEIWVKDRAWLSTVLHEMVHALQWADKGPTGFLEAYLDAMTRSVKANVLVPISKGTLSPKSVRAMAAANTTAYKANPAEKQAYKYSDGFEEKIKCGLHIGLGAKPPAYTMAEFKTQLKGTVTDEGIMNAVKKEGSLNITVAGAVLGL